MYIFVILLALLFFRGTVETFLYIFFRIEMGKWKLRIVIILGIAFFLEGLLHNMKRFYVVFSGLRWGNGNLEYIFIHILLNGACWPQKRAIERQMIFPNVLALIKLPAYYIFFFIMKPKV